MTTLKLMTTYSSCFVLVPVLALSLHQLILWRARRISKWLDEDSSHTLGDGNMMVSLYNICSEMNYDYGDTNTLDCYFILSPISII